jgi:hypothetical protein
VATDERLLQIDKITRQTAREGESDASSRKRKRAGRLTRSAEVDQRTDSGLFTAIKRTEKGHVRIIVDCDSEGQTRGETTNLTFYTMNSGTCASTCETRPSHP